jgi:hypothetical protein
MPLENGPAGPRSELAIALHQALAPKEPNMRGEFGLAQSLPDDLDGVMPMTPADPVGAKVCLQARKRASGPSSPRLCADRHRPNAKSCGRVASG